MELFAHRGNAHGDSGIPVLGPYAVTVFPPGLQYQEYNTTIFAQTHMRRNKREFGSTQACKHTHACTHLTHYHKNTEHPHTAPLLHKKHLDVLYEMLLFLCQADD